MSDSQHAASQKSTAAKARKAGAQTGAESSSASNQHPLIALQRMIGNRAVTQMLGVHAKLTVGAADDKYEAEADSVAQQVMSTPDSAASAPVQRADEDEMAAKRVDVMQRAEEDEMAAKRVDVVQRAEEDEMAAKRVDVVQRAEEDEMAAKRVDVMQRAEEDEMAAKRSDVMRDDQAGNGVDMMGSFDVGGDLEQRIESKSGSGQALDDGVRGFMEPRFGQDFSGVRVHTDSESSDLNNAIQAKAFTKGSDIFFKSGEYQPDTQDGKQLLAHELTHVVQQTGGK
ncbi:MAG: DUF4157 domain-containing protein [Anaerolineae bacterium]